MGKEWSKLFNILMATVPYNYDPFAFPGARSFSMSIVCPVYCLCIVMLSFINLFVLHD